LPNSFSRTKQWNKIRAKLSKQFREWGITRCELNYDGCQGVVHGFAHRYKRWACDEEELHIVVAACNNCHAKIEGKRHDDLTGQLDMGEIITIKVNERNEFLRLRGFTVKDVVWKGPKYR
jgi:hypothetical protein